MATAGIGRQSRLCVILVKVGTPVARAVFEKRVKDLTPTNHNPFPWTVDEFLLANKSKLRSLKLPCQTWTKVYPIQSHTVKLEHWDLALLCRILTECCDLRSDIRLDVNQLRKSRNKFFHMSEPSIDDDKYHHYLDKLKVIFDRCLKEINDDAFMNEMNKMFEDLEQGHFSQVDLEEVMKHLKFMEEETKEKLTELGQNMNEGIKEIIQRLEVIEAIAKDQKSHSLPVAATGVEIAVKNCATAKEKEISERLVQYFEEVIRDDVEFPKLPESFQQNIREAVFKACKLFLSKGYKIVEADDRCVFLRFKFTSLVSLISFLRECVSGELTLQLQEVQDAVRMLDGCEDVTLEAVINTEEVLTALHEIEVTISSSMKNGNIPSNSASSTDKNADVKIREVRLVNRKTEDSNEVTNGVQMSFENCSPEYIQNLEKSFENGEMDTAMKRIQEAVASEFQTTDVTITAHLFQENETVKQEKTSPTYSDENGRKRVASEEKMDNQCDPGGKTIKRESSDTEIVMSKPSAIIPKYMCDIHHDDVAHALCHYHKKLLCLSCVLEKANHSECSFTEIGKVSGEKDTLLLKCLSVRQIAARKERLIEEHSTKISNLEDELKQEVTEMHGKLTKRLDEMKENYLELIDKQATSTTAGHELNRQRLVTLETAINAHIEKLSTESVEDEIEIWTKLEEVKTEVMGNIPDKVSVPEGEFKPNNRLMELILQSGASLGSVSLIDPERYDKMNDVIGGARENCLEVIDKQDTCATAGHELDRNRLVTLETAINTHIEKLSTESFEDAIEIGTELEEVKTEVIGNIPDKDNVPEGEFNPNNRLTESILQSGTSLGSVSLIDPERYDKMDDAIGGARERSSKAVLYSASDVVYDAKTNKSVSAEPEPKKIDSLKESTENPIESDKTEQITHISDKSDTMTPEEKSEKKRGGIFKWFSSDKSKTRRARKGYRYRISTDTKDNKRKRKNVKKRTYKQDRKNAEKTYQESTICTPGYPLSENLINKTVKASDLKQHFASPCKFSKLVDLGDGYIGILSEIHNSLVLVGTGGQVYSKKTFKEGKHTVAAVVNREVAIIAEPGLQVTKFTVSDKGFSTAASFIVNEEISNITGFEYDVALAKFAVSSPDKVIVLDKSGKKLKASSYVSTKTPATSEIATTYDFSNDCLYIMNIRDKTLKMFSFENSNDVWKRRFVSDSITLGSMCLYKDKLCISCGDAIVIFSATTGKPIVKHDTYDLLDDCFGICVIDEVIVLSSNSDNFEKSTTLAYISL